MKQLKIRNFFGYDAQMGEDGKLDEELTEVIGALIDYRINPNQETLKHLLNELDDAKNVAEGEYLYNGGCLQEIASEKEFKLCKTESIINKIPSNTKDKVAAYDKIRYGG